MAARDRKISDPTRIAYRYCGGDVTVPDLPARDLTDADVANLPSALVALAVTLGLYEEVPDARTQ